MNVPVRRFKSAGSWARILCVLCIVPFASTALAQTFNQIQFTVATGTDDLRGDSSATVALIGTSGATLQTVTLKAQSAPSWSNGSSHTVTATLSPTLTRAAIGSVKLTLTSHNGFAESNDNWNVNTVTASLSNNGNGAVSLFSSAGNPLVRLTGSAPSFTINVPPPSAPGTFNQIAFTIGTGSDDLRGDSSVVATLQAGNGSTLQTITLKSQSGPAWNNNTTNTVTSPLTTPLAPSAIAHVMITLTSHNGFGETGDNWNINGVNIALSNNGSGEQPLMNFSGMPLARLTGSQPSVTLPPVPIGPAGTFNQIQFVIGTGSDDLREDSSVTATLQAANGSMLQTINIKSQSASAWSNSTTNTVSAPLNPPLAPASIARVVITLISHNSIGETSDNWNINNVTISLTNNGTSPVQLMSFSGAPLARLTGVQPSLTLPPPRASAGLGMTMPVNPDAEIPNLNLNPSLPGGGGQLPFGYNVVPVAFEDITSTLSGTCSNSNNKACLPAWNGNISEQDGRLNPFLRTNAASHDAKLLLGRAVWLGLGLSLPGSVQGLNCNNTNAACSTALAQLAVTGREAFNTFVGWNPSFAPSSSGPQVADLVQLVQQGHGDLPAVAPTISNAQLTAVCEQVLTDAYTALWAIRSNDPAWRQFRLNSGWIAVSGEDDAPHRPVNVFTAPYPQFDVSVPVKVAGNAFTLTSRYMIAAGSTLMNLVPGQPPTQAPAIPTITPPSRFPCSPALNRCPHRLAIPNDDPAALLSGQLRSKNVIIYIHGGGSRLEEAVPMATQFVTKFGDWSNNLIVISFDLPNSGYDDPKITTTDGNATRIALDASSAPFENGFNGTAPGNVNNFPVLNFTINFINNLISTLDSKGILNAHQVLAVMGGSLGGNTSLLLGMNPMMPPIHLDHPLAFSAPASAPGGTQPTIVSWSPTSMVSFHDEAGIIIAGNMCCLPTAGPTWERETGSTRQNYFHDLYFKGTSPGLPPDPEMWYRDDWNDAQGRSAATSFITQSRFDRYEIYSTITRLWTTSIDTEQAVFSFQNNTDISGQSYQPMYNFIRARLMMASGACDDYDNGGSTTPFAPPPTMSTGTCAGHGIGNTGSNTLNHQDIYGFTHDVANDMRNATGRTLFLNDTGHSIHDERPIFFAQQIFNFLTMPDNNINITLRTGNDDLRWNSEVHAIVTIPFGARPSGLSTTFDFPLNYWFHPWPATSSSPNNPCGACYKLTAFHMASGSDGGTTENNFTIALPWNTSTSSVTSFRLEFIAGTASAGNVTDKWNLSAVSACLPGSTGGFISDGFPSNGTIQSFNPSSANQPITWLPTSFVLPSLSSRANNCSPLATNPPANSDVPGTIWSQGFQAQQ